MKRSINLRELNIIKEKILKAVKIEDRINFNDIKNVTGIDIAYTNEKIICACIVTDFSDLKVIERKALSEDILMDYYPDLIAFREGNVVIRTVKELKNKPDIIVIDGAGMFHPEKLGLATYVGTLLNIPSIGVSKKLVFGRLEEDKIIVKDNLAGVAVKTKEHANPVYITPGNDISIETSKKIVEKLCVGHKMPEPVHEAHLLAVKAKKP